jgi:hypothetical protein
MNDKEIMNIVNAFYTQIINLSSDLRRNSGYMARQEMQELIDKIKSNPNRLEQYGYKVYSQHDEDGILNEIFKRLGISKGTFLEIGVENGLECNSLYLIHGGWRGVWLEGNPSQKEAIESKFAPILKNRRLALDICFVTPQNINSRLKDNLASIGLDVNELDFLSIDIDGMDIYLLEALKYSPKVICIEYNSKFPPPMNKKPVYSEHYKWQGTDYMGSSLIAIDEVARAKGYTLVATNINGTNAFFVRNDIAKDKFEKDATPMNLYNPPRYHLFIDYFLNNPGHKADFGPYTDLE